MNTYFIRHSASWEVDDLFRQRLWTERKIAIYYENVRSYDPNDYTVPSARRAVRAFRDLAQGGGYVCTTIAQYGCLVAKVTKGTLIAFEDIKLKDPSKTGIAKLLPLANAVEVPPGIADRLLIGQPQQGTICLWKVIGDRVRQLAETGKLSISQVSDLLPYEQEVMCSEFLRTEASEAANLPRLAHLSAPVGRTRKAIDVSGVTAGGRPILVQVTHHLMTSTETTQKAEALRASTRGLNANLILFCRADKPSEAGGIRFYPIQRVFEEMQKLSAWRSAIEITDASA